MKRVVIYAYYEKKGKVYDYVYKMLEELRLYSDYIVFVSNVFLQENDKININKVVDHCIERDNIGYDITAYKTGIEYIGYDNILKYDECILVNSSLFGPIFSFKDMFEKMQSLDIDFWGITKHHKVDFDPFRTCKYGYIPEHIQSSFIVFRKKFMSTDFFISRWKDLPAIKNYVEAIGLFEVIFTKEAVEAGYEADVYINTDDLEGYTRYPLMMMADELVINRKCPVIKIKSFSQNYYDILTDTIGNCTQKMYDYINKHTDYDVNLIWDYILQNFNMADIKNIMHLNYILPKYSLIDDIKINQKIALIVHIYYEDLLEDTIKYINNMPKTADLIITTPKKELVQKLKEKCSKLNFNDYKVLLIENRGRDVSSLLVGAAPYINDYDLVCYMHDKKTTQMKPYANGVGFNYKCFDNLLGSEKLIYNIIETFEKNPRLGMLMPPPPNHGNFYQIIGTEWASNYANTSSLLYNLNIEIPIDWAKEPITPLGTMFWFRPKVLKPLFDKNWEYTDFPQEPNANDGTLLHAIERSYGIVCQYEGYYPAWVMNDEYVRIEITNLHFMVRELNSKLFSHYFTTNLLDMTEKMRNHMYFKWDIHTSFKYKIKIFLKTILPRPIFNIVKRIYNRKVRGYE